MSRRQQPDVVRRLGLATTQTAAQAGPEQGSGTARHCWVIGFPQPGARSPALLLEWDRDEQGRWLGRVVVATPGHRGAVTTTLWLPSEMLLPLDGQARQQGRGA